MENVSILKSLISEKIAELNKRERVYSLFPIVDKGNIQIEKVGARLKSLQRLFNWIYLPVTCLLVVIVILISISEMFDYNFLNWNRAGLLVIMSIAMLSQTWILNHQIERLKMMKRP
jgi:hypothetical protein